MFSFPLNNPFFGLEIKSLYSIIYNMNTKEDI